MDVIGVLGDVRIWIGILVLLFVVAAIKVIGANKKNNGNQYERGNSGKASFGKVIAADLIDFVLVFAISALVSGLMIIWPLSYYVYQVVMLSLCKGRTIGNWITNTRLKRSTGVECKAIDVLIRSIVMTMPILIIVLFQNIYTITIVLALIYWLVPFFTKENCAIHDMVSNTYYFENVKQENAAWEKADTVVPVKEDVAEKSSAVESMKDEKRIYAQKEECVSHSVRSFLDAVSGDLAGMSFEIDREIHIGRDYSGNVILPSDAPEVSRHHCKLTLNKSDMTFALTDLNSSFGTFLGNGKQIPKGGTVQLNYGDEFHIGVDQRFKIRKE